MVGVAVSDIFRFQICHSVLLFFLKVLFRLKSFWVASESSESLVQLGGLDDI